MSATVKELSYYYIEVTWKSKLCQSFYFISGFSYAVNYFINVTID